MTHHVPTYHAWMQDADLRAATASELLSTEEEYEMQANWRMDNDKLTFIICSPPSPKHDKAYTCKPGLYDNPETMIGDINLFLSIDYEEENDDTADDCHRIIGEIELMIAKGESRRKGFGKVAIQIFISYVLSDWDNIAKEFVLERRNQLGSDPQLSFLRAKINQTNTGSIHLFESLGFRRTKGGVNYFGEVELRWQCGAKNRQIVSDWEHYDVIRYGDPSM